MLLTFPVMGIKLNSVDQTVEWQFDRVILLGVAIFFLSMLWNWCFSRKARGIPLIRLPEGLGKGLHSLVTLPNRNTTTRLTSLGLLLAVMIVMPLVSSFYQTNIMISAMLYVILALGLNIAVGIAGQLVLGYVAFYAVGAYSYALLNQAFGLGFWACLPVGGFMAIVFGLALGFPVLRLRGGAHGLAHAGIADEQAQGDHGQRAGDEDQEITGAHDVAQVIQKLHLRQQAGEGDIVRGLRQQHIVL